MLNLNSLHKIEYKNELEKRDGLIGILIGEINHITGVNNNQDEQLRDLAERIRFLEDNRKGV